MIAEVRVRFKVRVMVRVRDSKTIFHKNYFWWTSNCVFKVKSCKISFLGPEGHMQRSWLLIIGRASPSERAGFHPAFKWEKPALLPGLACLAKSPRLTTFIFPRNPGFSFYNLPINKQNL